MWFINEDAVPYRWDGTVEEQRAVYPMDCHTPYETEEEAWEASTKVCLCALDFLEA